MYAKKILAVCVCAKKKVRSENELALLMRLFFYRCMGQQQDGHFKQRRSKVVKRSPHHEHGKQDPLVQTRCIQTSLRKSLMLLLIAEIVRAVLKAYVPYQIRSETTMIL